MQVLTIIWTLICAAVIIGYPFFLFNKSSSIAKTTKERATLLASNTVELFSFDIRDQLPGWSFNLDIPQITEQVLYNNPILFYLESEEKCLKLPLNNASLGYTANVYKNTGKVYVTFKSLKDGVSNFYVPAWHLSKLKILIIKCNDKSIYGSTEKKLSKAKIYKCLQKAGVNINDYEDVLGYFSNIASIDFKGHFAQRHTSKKINPEQPTFPNHCHELSSVS